MIARMPRKRAGAAIAAERERRGENAAAKLKGEVARSHKDMTARGVL
jgi:hypothetical protein